MVDYSKEPYIIRGLGGDYSTVLLPSGIIETCWFSDDGVVSFVIGRTPLGEGNAFPQTTVVLTAYEHIRVYQQMTDLANKANKEVTMVPVAVEQPVAVEIKPDEQQIQILDASHRCIVYGCGAQAYVRVVFNWEDEVADYCAHHFAERADKLMAVAKHTHDERWRLNEVAKLDVSA